MAGTDPRAQRAGPEHLLKETVSIPLQKSITGIQSHNMAAKRHKIIAKTQKFHKEIKIKNKKKYIKHKNMSLLVCVCSEGEVEGLFTHL